MARLEVGGESLWKGGLLQKKSQINNLWRIASCTVVEGVIGLSIGRRVGHQPILQICNLILKLIEHILTLISRSIARAGGAGEFSSDEIELGPVSEDQVGESEEDGKDDWAPEEVDVGVDREHAVLVEQPRSVLHFWHEDLIIEEFF